MRVLAQEINHLSLRSISHSSSCSVKSVAFPVFKPIQPMGFPVSFRTTAYVSGYENTVRMIVFYLQTHRQSLHLTAKIRKKVEIAKWFWKFHYLQWHIRWQRTCPWCHLGVNNKKSDWCLVSPIFIVEQALLYSHLITTLNFVRARSRSEV